MYPYGINWLATGLSLLAIAAFAFTVYTYYKPAKSTPNKYVVRETKLAIEREKEVEPETEREKKDRLDRNKQNMEDLRGCLGCVVPLIIIFAIASAPPTSIIILLLFLILMKK
jgi:hypothetical protein